MKIAVCDDQEIFLDQMEKILEKQEEIEGYRLFQQVEALWKDMEEGASYDVILMDIEWKGKTKTEYNTHRRSMNDFRTAASFCHFLQ